MNSLNYTFSFLTNNYDKYFKEINLTIELFFRKIDINKTHKGDLFLCLNNAHILQNVFIPGNNVKQFTGLFSEDDIYFYQEISTITVNYLKQGNTPENHYFVMQLQMFSYLKFWESESVYRFFINSMTRLLHKESYNWEIKVDKSTSKTLYYDNCQKALKNKCPKMLRIISKIYNPSIRNFIAHSNTLRFGDYFKNNKDNFLFDGKEIDNINDWNNFYTYFLIFIDILNKKSQKEFFKLKDTLLESPIYKNKKEFLIKYKDAEESIYLDPITLSWEIMG